jgi:hypothetical protein
MSVAKELTKELNDKVEQLLLHNPSLRDSDRRLSCRLWCNILGGEETVRKYSGWDFLCAYANANGVLPSQESIGRARRKLQENNPLLRGSKYIERHEAQKDVKKQLGYKSLKENYEKK